MKKKILTILVVVILVLSVMSVCFVGCKNNNDNTPSGGQQPSNPSGGNDDPSDNPSGGQANAVNEEQAGYLKSYVEAWVVNNAGETAPEASALQDALNGVRAAWTNIKKTKVTLESNTYTIKVTFKDNSTKDVTVKAVLLDANRYQAGTAYDPANSTMSSIDGIFAPVYNALMKTIKTAVENGMSFATDEKGDVIFSANAELRAEVLVGHFGEVFGGMSAPFDYALHIGGNIGKEAKDTQVAIEVKQGQNNGKSQKTIVGLYYIGAAQKADCKIYLGIDVGDYQQKLYIDNANLNELVINLIDSISKTMPADGNELAAAEEEAPFWEKKVNSLSDLLADMGISDTISSVIIGVVNSVLKGNMGYKSVTGGTRYQVQIDVKALLDTVLEVEMVSEIVGGLVSEIDLLKDLDVKSMQGIGGKLVLSVTVNTDGTLGGVEVNYNVDESDFRFNESDTVSKAYGPINLALSVKEFSLGKQNVQIGIGNQREYTYFSPLNLEAQADFSLTETGDHNKSGNYHLSFVSDINPFDFENGVLQLTVTDKKDGSIVLNAYGETFWAKDGGLDIAMQAFYEGKTYAFNISETGAPLWAFIEGAVMDKKSVCAPVVEYIKDLMAQFSKDEAQAGEAQPTVGADEGEEGFNPMGLVNVITGLKELLENLKKEGFIDYPENIDFEHLENFYFKAELNNVAYNEALVLLREALPGLKDFDANAAKVNVYVNYKEEYKGRIFVDVDYLDWKVVVDLSIKDWDTAKKLAYANVTIKHGKDVKVYDARLDASGWDDPAKGAHLTYTVKEGTKDADTYVDVTVKQLKATANNGFNVHAVLTTIVEGQKKDHVFDVVVKHEDNGGYSFQGTANGHTVRVYAGHGHWNADSEHTLSWGIPTPECGFEASYELDSNKSVLVVTSASITNWGKAIDNKPTNAKPAGNDALQGKAAVDALIEVLETALTPYIYVK